MDNTSTTNKPSLFDKLSSKIGNITLPPLLINFILSLLFTFLASFFAIKIAIANHFFPLHNDPAVHLMNALQVYDIVNIQGPIATFFQALHAQDSFDVVARVLFAPFSLNTLFGHMYVVVPFLFLFIFLMIHYLQQRGSSWIGIIATVSFLFVLPLILSPYKGIADFWKESIAVWILGSAVICWLLCGNLTKSGWSFLCALLMGILVLERPALAIYLIVLLTPLGMWAVIQRYRVDGAKKAAKKIIIFLAPCIILGTVAVITQYHSLYVHYIVAGYGYGSLALAMNNLYDSLFTMYRLPTYNLIFPLLSLCLAIVWCCMTITDWKKQYKDILLALWFLLGFPFIIIISGTLYHSFGTIWGVLFIITLATFIPTSFGKKITQSVFLSILSLLVFCSIIYQCMATFHYAKELDKFGEPFRQRNKVITDIIFSQPTPHYVSFLFADMGATIANYLRLERHIQKGSPAEIHHLGFVSMADSYYSMLNMKESTNEEIATKIMKDIEQHNGAIVFEYCDPETLPHFPYESKVAKPIMEFQSRYLLTNLHWKAIAKINDAYVGCIYAYQYTSTPVSEVEKWQDIQFNDHADMFPTNLSLLPDVKLIHYRSVTPVHFINGEYLQNLPIGTKGIVLQLFTDKLQHLVLNTSYISKSVPDKDNVSLQVTLNHQMIEKLPLVNKGELIQVNLTLQPGLNILEMMASDEGQFGELTKHASLLIRAPWLNHDLTIS